MRAVIQRVENAGVSIDGKETARIGRGALILLGVGQDDTEAAARKLASKAARLRIHEDEEGKMNRSLIDIGGAALVVSQFTLLGDARKGNRPSFVKAAPPDRAEPLYESFCEELAAFLPQVQRGVFGAHMKVFLVNDGPVTILMDTD